MTAEIDRETFVEILELYGRLLSRLHDAGILKGEDYRSIMRRYNITEEDLKE